MIDQVTKYRVTLFRDAANRNGDILRASYSDAQVIASLSPVTEAELLNIHHALQLDRLANLLTQLVDLTKKGPKK